MLRILRGEGEEDSRALNARRFGQRKVDRSDVNR